MSQDSVRVLVGRPADRCALQPGQLSGACWGDTGLGPSQDKHFNSSLIFHSYSLDFFFNNFPFLLLMRLLICSAIDISFSGLTDFQNSVKLQTSGSLMPTKTLWFLDV